MSGNPKTVTDNTTLNSTGLSYGADCSLVDFILGITFEIWEQRRVETILQYYSEDVVVYSLDGITHGAATMVRQTHETLAAYPDRLLLGDDVIGTGDARKGFSSHRISSPMTHLGDSLLAAATGRSVRIMNIADCEVNDGRITREWLVRDNLALVNQLGIDPLDAARAMADRSDEELKAWIRRGFERTVRDRTSTEEIPEADSVESFARRVLECCWVTGNPDALKAVYAPYCVMQRAPVRIYSGRERVLEHYAGWRGVFPEAILSIDHICSQPFNQTGQNIAVRWSIAGMHEGEFAGREASGRPVYILGVTHWKVVDGRIAAEWTVFDELAMLAQTLI